MHSSQYIHIIQRKHAKTLGLKRYFTGKPCKNGHVSLRSTHDGSCLECKRLSGIKSDAKRRRDPSRKEYMKSYMATYQCDKEKKNKRSRERYAENSDRERERSKMKRLANKGYYRRKCAERKDRLRNERPRWVDERAVNQIYIEATSLSLEVDHIVPVTSNYVCGLHCHQNMQMLSRSDNAIKGNRTWPDMPNISDPDLTRLVMEFKNELV